jgi:hypothetical protein
MLRTVMSSTAMGTHNDASWQAGHVRRNLGFGVSPPFGYRSILPLLQQQRNGKTLGILDNWDPADIELLPYLIQRVVQLRDVYYGIVSDQIEQLFLQSGWNLRFCPNNGSTSNVCGLKPSLKPNSDYVYYTQETVLLIGKSRVPLITLLDAPTPKIPIPLLHPLIA